MARLKNQKSSVAKDTKTVAKSVKAAPVATAQSAVASKTDVKTNDSVAKTVEPEEKKEEAVKSVTPAKAEPAAKEEVKPVETKAPAEKKTTTKKTAAKKPVAKKTAVKKVEKEVVQEVYFQYNNEEILSQDIVSRIQEEYKNEGHRVSSIKSLRVYIKPEERKAFYVINDKAEGKFIEF